MPDKTLAVVTSTRAEYGLLRPVLQKVHQSTYLDLQLIVTGAHLAPEFGNTVQEIEADAMPIAARIPILKFGTGSPLATARTVAYTLDAFSVFWARCQPDAALVLGDRYEIFAVAQAAAMLAIPLFHISGGDVTRGAADDYYRHCITKMACLHFPSCAEYANRVIRLGEAPETVHNVGGLGDENLRNMALLDPKALGESIGFDVTQPYALVTFHPETAGNASPVQQFTQLLEALDETGLRCIFTKANADAGGQKINALIDAYCARRPQQAIAFASMGALRYLSAMRFAAVVVGNSSSGVVETPTLGVPAVNIGQRQAGRILCDNVICCTAEAQQIRTAIQKALTPAFAACARAVKSPYDGGDTSGEIVRAAEAFLQSDKVGTPKEFYDGPAPERED